MIKRWFEPTLSTKFWIDRGWWEKSNKNIRLFLHEFLCPDCHSALALDQETLEIDWVDPDTGEVRRVDALWHSVQSCCSEKPDYITPSTPFVESVFRTFAANGNQPLSVTELYELLDRRPPAAILRMLTHGRIYLGIRPVA